jgi:histidinol-phosphate aminotransferase
MLRRTFVRTVGAGTVAAVGGHILGGGRVLGPWTRNYEEALLAAQGGRPLLLHNNENPLGPGDKVLAIMRQKLVERGYPTARYTSPAGDLRDVVAAKFKCKPANVLIGCGSTQILRTTTFTFTSPTRALVGGMPTYEECSDVARLIGAPVRGVPGTSTLHHDLDAMAAAAKGAGLVFFDNPANPAATLHKKANVLAFFDKVMKESPEPYILVDEAYFDYVTDPDHQSYIPLALENPRIIVARTFSKAYGMAGLRVGYAIGHAETIAKIRANHYDMSTNVLGLSGAIVSIQDDGRLKEEAQRNTVARQFTSDWFKKAGCTPTDSQCNFLFVNVGRPAKEFRDGCAKDDVRVGRDFPPFEKTHVRVSIGTLDEMKQAVQTFGKVLGVKASAAA